MHVRRATVGSIDSFNSHPFRHGTWMFAHNGTIFDFEKLESRIMAELLPDFIPLIFGSTDSERYFFFLLSHMIRAGISKSGRGDVDNQEQHAVMHCARDDARDGHTAPFRRHRTCPSSTAAAASR